MLTGINGATSGTGVETVTSLLSSLFSGENSLSNGSSATTNQSTASISNPGQLLNNLEQLQSSNPAKFQQVVSQIANQLSTAAKNDGQAPQGEFLTKLAGEFQKVAGGGSLSQLHLHAHGNHGQQTYTQNGQPVSSPALGNSQQANAMQQLFTNLSNDVQVELTGGSLTGS